jgi:hypothetical protein
LNLPCTAISGERRDLGGKQSARLLAQRVVHSNSTSRVASSSRATSSSDIFCDIASGDSFARCRISSEYALPMPLKSVGSVSERLSV